MVKNQTKITETDLIPVTTVIREKAYGSSLNWTVQRCESARSWVKLNGPKQASNGRSKQVDCPKSEIKRSWGLKLDGL